MKRPVLTVFAVIMISRCLVAQPEYYSDVFLGLPEFHARIARIPTPNPDSVAVEVHVRIVYDDLQFIKKDNVYNAGYSLDVILRDKDDRLKGHEHLVRKVTVKSYTKTNSRQQGSQTVTLFTTTPDKFDLKILLTDDESRKNRILEKGIDFPENNWGDEMRLGELLSVDSTGLAQLTTGILRGEELRIYYRLFCKIPDSLSVIFQLRDDNDHLIQHGRVTPPQGKSYFADTIVIPTDSLANQPYYFLLTARSGKTAITRRYSFKILWQNLPDYIMDLQTAIKQLKHVATDEEYDHLMNAPPSRQQPLFNQFWKKKDPTPSTTANEKMEEYYRRVRYANMQFRGYREGWRSDMGKIYIIFGPPTDIERHPFSVNTKPYEIWYYYDLNRQFIFVDNEGFGEYRLKTPFWK